MYGICPTIALGDGVAAEIAIGAIGLALAMAEQASSSVISSLAIVAGDLTNLQEKLCQ